MPQSAKFPKLVTAALVVFVCLFALRYMTAIGSGVGHLTAVRTYAFWAIVTIPVALLADVLGRTIMNYRIVKALTERLAVVSQRDNK